MSSTPREIGTLIVVILKARHLPNKRHIGKQDPYCLVELNGDKRRTKAIKRGGQHPEWDEEVRFTLYEDTDDVLARTAGGDDKPPTPPPKEQKLKIKGGKSMALACYADDAREPDLIGEATVDLTEVLTKGETDEWFPLMHKEKFAGEVYLELTFWSNEPAPEKKVKSKASTGSKQYGGPGSFTPARDGPPSGQTSRIVSTSALYDRPHIEAPDSLPQSLRASNSLAQLDLYVPPYEQRRGPSPTDNLANDFGQLGLADNRRRESYPPPTHGHRPSTSVSYSTTLTPSSFYQPGYPPQPEYDQQQPLYPSPYDPPSQFVPEPASYPPQPTPSRGPRYSIPATSSGFMPIQSNPPTTYNQPLYNPSNFASHPPPVQQPSTGPYPQPSSFHPLPQPPFQYPQYGSVTPAPPQTFGQPVVPPPLPVTPQPHPQYQQYHTPSPSHGESSPISSLSSSLGAGSRPLPQPVPTQQLPFPPPATNTLPPPVGQYGVAANNPYASVPPPPPLPVPPQAPPPPVQSYQTNSPSANQTYQIPNPGPPPPLPPSSQPFNNAQRRRLSLPQPPINMQQALQNIPPPPPLPNSLPHPPPTTGPSTPPSPSHISNYTQPPYQGHPSYLPPPSDQQWQQPQAYPQSQWT